MNLRCHLSSSPLSKTTFQGRNYIKDSYTQLHFTSVVYHSVLFKGVSAAKVELYKSTRGASISKIILLIVITVGKGGTDIVPNGIKLLLA